MLRAGGRRLNAGVHKVIPLQVSENVREDKPRIRRRARFGPAALYWRGYLRQNRAHSQRVGFNEL